MPRGFSNRELREHIAQLRGLRLDQLTQGMMTYDLRRLRLHRLIRRVPKTHRYEVTPFGIVAALFLTRLYVRQLRPSFAALASSAPPPSLKRALEHLESEVDRLSEHATQT